MALTGALKLKINDSDVPGYTTAPDLHGEGSIEVLDYVGEVTSPREAETGRSIGRRQYMPIEVLKRVDDSSPLLFKALTKNEKADLEFLFYRPDPSGAGTLEQHYTILLENARVSAIRKQNESPVAKTAESPVEADMLERVTFVFETITETFNPTGGTHADSLRGA